MSIFVLVLVVCSVIVVAAQEESPPAVIEVDIDGSGDCCISVDYRFNRGINQWEYNGAADFGWQPVSLMKFDYYEGYKYISTVLAGSNEQTGYFFFNTVKTSNPTLLGEGINGVTVDGIPSLPPPPPTPTVVQREAPKEEAKPVEEPRRVSSLTNQIGSTPYHVDKNGDICVQTGNECTFLDESLAEDIRNNPDYDASLAEAKRLAEQDARIRAEQKVVPPPSGGTDKGRIVTIYPTAGTLTNAQKELISSPEKIEIIEALQKNGKFIGKSGTIYYRNALGDLIIVNSDVAVLIQKNGQVLDYEGTILEEGASSSTNVETLKPQQIIVSPDCGSSCTIASSVIRNENERKDQTKTPPVVFVNGKTHEPFWNGEEWDYCAGEGCSRTSVTEDDHATIIGGETIIFNPGVNEIGATGFYTDEFENIYTCPEATQECQVTEKENLNKAKSDQDYQKSVDALVEKIITKYGRKTPSTIDRIKKELACFENSKEKGCKGLAPKTVGEAYEELNGIATEREKDVAALQSEVDTLREKVAQFPPGKPSAEEKKVRAQLQNAVDNLNKAEKEAKEYREAADSLEGKRSWLDTWKSGDAYKEIVASQQLINKFGLGLEQLGQYQALSTLIMPKQTKAFVDATNFGPLNALADLPGYASRELCEAKFVENRKTPGQSAAYVFTAAGTYQFVGAIHTEKSTDRVPILCQKRPFNESEEGAEEEFFCKGSLVCKDDGFCYKDKNAKTPELGNFYKITWGVAAPSDEKSTPYIDEDGKAVKFNLQLVGGNNPWLFKRGRLADDSVIELTNGARDGGTIVHFSEIDYTEVCIRFDDKYRVKDYFDGDVKEICEPFVETNRGAVEFAQSDKTTSTPSTAAEVTLDTEW